jgi:hypothetical protein
MAIDDQEFDYDGSTFQDVKSTTFSGPYPTLPHHQGLGPKTFIQFFNDSARNLHDKRDIRPRFDKLIHANGICYSGIWRIDPERREPGDGRTGRNGPAAAARREPFTGYFAPGSEGLIVARMSVAGPELTRGYRRAFGIAGKVYPTLDPTLKVKPGNFVTVSGLSGSKAPHILDIAPTNMPEVGPALAANVINRIIFRLMDTRPGYRQLYPISTLGVPRGAPVRTPDLLMLKVPDDTPRVDAEDFRDELRLKNYPGNTLTYVIYVKMFDDADWSRIGQIDFTEDAICEGCDKRIHFWIPRDIPRLDELEAQRDASIAAVPAAAQPAGSAQPTAERVAAE